MRRYALRDDQWDRIKDILPGREGHVGGTAADNRLFVEAVLFRFRAGVPWRDLRELPGREGHVGGTATDNRLFVEAVLFRFRAGARGGICPRALATGRSSISASTDLPRLTHERSAEEGRPMRRYALRDDQWDRIKDILRWWRRSSCIRCRDRWPRV
jgi:hypothetical protein